jgi:3'(2'), 5'-bisphosphate nucleotidase
MSQAWSRERETAIAAVRRAAQVCRAVQQQLVSAQTLEKKDKSPVTVADFASQAVVCAGLAQAFPADPVVAEEGTGELRLDEQAPLRRAVVTHAAKGLGRELSEGDVLAAIDHGSTGTGHEPRFWTLDPIDGTKGFLRREQYVVALALLEQGRVVLGVLGCPGLMAGAGQGALLVAVRGQGTQLLPLDGASIAGPIMHVSAITDPSQGRFCESVEAAHSDQGMAARIAAELGIHTQPIRMDSQAKYAVVARGEASIYLRLPTRADYRECIWDHAAGMAVIEEAGGTVTDVEGKPLEFTHGRRLEGNRGIVATGGKIHDRVLAAVAKALRG